MQCLQNRREATGTSPSSRPSTARRAASAIFRSWTAASLEGPWTVLHDDAQSPFAGTGNVSFEGPAWTQDISHGEMIRAGYDETMEVDGTKLQYLYQGFDAAVQASDYNAIPWRLGLLTIR